MAENKIVPFVGRAVKAEKCEKCDDIEAVPCVKHRRKRLTIRRHAISFGNRASRSNRCGGE
jgi:hypothetical protein